MKSFLSKRNFQSLCVKDLVEAREHYHLHLIHLENVVATAIGRYLIRSLDPDAAAPRDYQRLSRSRPRTLANSSVKRWSWPCVLVFVERWLDQPGFARSPENMVPPFLYMPDGRVVPTCVVLAEKARPTPSPLLQLNFPSEVIGGGYPVMTEVQGQEHVGSIGCLVTDGELTYALTNKHVTGAAGTKVFTIVRGEPREIGTSHEKQAGKKWFENVYPGWPGSRVLVNLDAGLIRLEDVSRCTSQIFGVGELDRLVDMHVDSISLDLVGVPLKAFGGASGPLQGRILGLFYRYRTVAGFEYVADLLIAPEGPAEASPTSGTRPGDSGTLWVWDPGRDTGGADPEPRGRLARRFRPLAVQWGGQTLQTPGGQQGLQFALATFLSTICREMDLEIVGDWETGHAEYWGKIGHYKIGAKACQLPADSRLNQLMMSNLDRIAFDDPAIGAGALDRIDTQAFVPLADVPDFVWRKTRKKDDRNHFADMDQPGKGAFNGRTLLDLCENPKMIHAGVWDDFYAALGIDKGHRGALPFRVWQIYEEMVGHVRHRDVPKFICAAGILAHYVGDACQPLHISFLHHGSRPEEKDVHAVYEEGMLEMFAGEMLSGINDRLAGRKVKAGIKGGFEAARAVVRLMRRAHTRLPPSVIIAAFNAASGRQRKPLMWSRLKKRTMDGMAAGALCLASLWAGAWAEGGGGKIPASRLKGVRRDVLMKLYNDRSFLVPLSLAEMAAQGIGIPPA